MEIDWLELQNVLNTSFQRGKFTSVLLIPDFIEAYANAPGIRDDPAPNNKAMYAIWIERALKSVLNCCMVWWIRMELCVE